MFFWLLLAFVLVRGVNLSLIQMPFEGWDEYQHLAVAEYVHEHGAAPDYGERVPEALFDFLRRHPHPDDSARQLAGIGARNYDGKYWDPGNGKWANSEAPAPPVRMYQAQQGPLYYRFLSAIRGSLAADDPGLWADAGRLFNVLFAVFSVALWARILSHFLRGAEHYLVAVVLSMTATDSLYAYNYAHVANDALAILIFSACVLGFVRLEAPGGRSATAYASVLGVLTGLAVLAKATTLILVPFAYVMFLRKAWNERNSAYVFSIVVFSMAYLLVAGSYHAQSLDKYGLITGMQEALVNRRNDKGLMDLIAALQDIHFRDIKRTFVYGLLHEGGWSYVKPDMISYRVYQALVVLTIVGTAAAAFVRRYRQRLLARTKQLFPLLLLLALTWAAMLYHGLQTVVAWGSMTARAPYAMAVFPVVCIVLLGLAVFPKRVTALLGVSYCLVFSSAYYAGTWKLLDLYREGGGLGGKLDYVLSHHSSLVQSYPLQFSLVLELVLAGALLFTLIGYCLAEVAGTPRGGLSPASAD